MVGKKVQQILDAVTQFLFLKQFAAEYQLHIKISPNGWS